MTFETLEAELLDHFPELSDRGLMKRSANRVIRDINQLIQGVRETQRALTYIGSLVGDDYAWAESSTVAGEYYLTDSGGSDPDLDEPTEIWKSAAERETAVKMSSGTIGSLSNGEWEWGFNAGDGIAYNTVYLKVSVGDPDGQADGYLKAYDIATDYTWDETTAILTLKDTVKDLRNIFLEEDELEAKGYGYVTDSENTDEDVYYPYSHNELLFPTALIGEGEKIYIEQLRLLAEITSTASSTTLDVPAMMKNTFLAGVHRDLATMPQYADENLFQLYNEKWQVGVISLDNLMVDHLPDALHDVEWLY